MPDPTTDPNPASLSGRRPRRALWLGGGLLALAALLYLVVPPLARQQAETILSEKLGREVRVERVLINPFRLTAEVGGFSVKEADGSADALAFETLRVNLELESLVRGGVVLHELALIGPRLRVAVDEQGGHNWADVIERLAALGGEDKGDAGPTLFSVGNIRIAGGLLTVHDKARGLTHELSEIGLGVPFLSNLPVRVDVFVQPSLSAKLNGDPLLLSARTKPFADSHETILDVVLQQFDLAPWLAYLPAEVGVRLPSALLTTNVEISFRQPAGAAPELALRGPLKLEQVVLQDRDGAPLAKVAEAELEFADVQPLIGRWQFTRLRLAQPEVDVIRRADGSLNLAALMPPAHGATTRGAAAVPAEGGGQPAPAAASPAPAVDFLLALARVRDGVIRFEDQGVGGPFRMRIEAINLDMRDLASSGDLPAELRLDYRTDAGEQFVHEDRLRLQPFEFAGQTRFDALQLARYAPYLAAALPGGELRAGTLSGAANYRVVLGEDGQPKVDLSLGTLALREFAFALKGAKEPAVRVPELDLSEAVLDLEGRRLRLGTLDVKGAAVAAVRLRNGDLDLVRALSGPAPEPRAAAGRRKQPQPPPQPDWVVELDKLALKAASLRLEDRSVGRPVLTTIDDIDFELEGFSSAKGNTSQFKLDSRLNKRGRVAVSGPLSLTPLKAELRLDLRSVDLMPLQPYVLEQTKIAISRGNLTTQGRLNLQTGRRGQLLASFRGDLGVANFASVDRLNATDFVRWRTLRVGGIDARLEPFSLAIRRVAIDDFHTRLILDEEGRLNLREIGGGGSQTAATQSAPPTSSAGGGSAAASSAQGPDAVAADGPPPPPVRIDRIEIKRGNVAFSDRFIRPNYDANLTGLAGEIVGLSTSSDTIARVELSGEVDKTAPLSISGELNPFRQDAHLDIVAKVKDFELTGLSSYSGKYVGYGIARGKLSAELNYKIEDRRLTATNQIFLDQLTFGDKVDSPDAVNLPVQLAVSLLKNSRGEIDLHLPVSGTLDDPEFSVFGLVVKMFFNLIGKAITSPFTLLGAAFGGGEALSHLELAPGSGRLDEAQQDKLAKLARALAERPALRLDVIGRADPASDLDGLRQAGLDNALRAQKLKALIARGEEAPSLDDIEVGADEYPALLEKAYKAADIKKPRNLVGLVKDIPAADMEALLRASVSASEAELRALAQRRAQAVREWMIAQGGIPGERIFVLEPKVEPVAEGGQVQFSLR